MMKDCTNGGCECTPNQSIKCTVNNCAHREFLDDIASTVNLFAFVLEVRFKIHQVVPKELVFGIENDFHRRESRWEILDKVGGGLGVAHQERPVISPFTRSM